MPMAMASASSWVALTNWAASFGVGQHLAVVELADGADAVFLAGFAGFQRAQAAQFAFHR